MKKHFLLVFLSFCFSGLLSAQRENTWVFGLSPGKKLDFNSTIPTLSSTPFFSVGEATASICDVTGQLLFYTEGDTLWDKNGNVMPNGAGLTGLPSAFGYTATGSTSQGALIVPALDNPDKYFVFSLTDQAIGPAFLGVSGNLYYSIIDMTSNGGLGDVVPGQKGILIGADFTESMYGVAGNDCNYWIVLAAFSASGQSDIFKSFEITENGLNMTPVVSSVGGPPYSLQADIGKITISPDRTKLARTRMEDGGFHNLELFDFDPATGVVSNLINLDSAYYTPYYGVCFSPDNTKLYAAGVGTSALYQFDLSTADFISSKTLIDSVSYTDIKSAPDGQLYYIPSNSNNYLKKISYPDQPGIACQPVNSAVQLKQTNESYSFFSFPNHVPIITPDTSYATTHYDVCPDQESFILQNSDAGAFWVRWDDSSTGNSRAVTESGTYWVQHSNYCTYGVDTFIVNKVDLSPVITVNVFDLSTTMSYDTYQWFLNGNIIPGATNAIYTVTENGDYSVVVGNETGCTDTSGIYKVTNTTAIHDGSLVRQRIRIYPNPADDRIYIDAPLKVKISLSAIEGRFIKEFPDPENIRLGELAEGVYLLQITDNNGRLLQVERIVKTK